MTASPSQQRRILKDYKYPDPEGTAQAAYYRNARNAIQEFHMNGHDADWLVSKADALNSQKSGPPARQTRITKNVQALRKYAASFSSRKIQSQAVSDLKYSHAGLSVNVTPDLFGIELDRYSRLVKIQFAKSNDPEKNAKIIGQVMLTAASAAGLTLPSSAMRVWDCQTGEDYKLARVGARMEKDIEAACENIMAIWQGI